MKKEIPEELKQEIIRKHNEGLSLRKLVAEINNPLVTLQTVRTVLKNSLTSKENPYKTKRNMLSLLLKDLGTSDKKIALINGILDL